MNIIENNILLNSFYEKYKLYDLFSDEVKDNMKLFLFNKHEHICSVNDTLNYFFFFVHGKAKIYTTLSNGKSLLLCFYTPLKVLGDLEAINNNKYPCNVQVLEDSYCIGLKLDYVKNNLLDNPKFLRFICNALGEKLTNLGANTSINLLYKLENRLASYIISTAIKNYDGKFIFNENLTNTAELLGTSYRHLLRTLNYFCSNDILIKKNSIYQINDIDILNKLSSDLYEKN